MYIIDDIVYAGEAPTSPSVCGIRPLSDYRLWIRFSTGEAKIFDCTPLLSFPAFIPLQNPEVFSQVYIDYGTATWCDGSVDIAPETLYSDGVPAEANAIA
ncbi:Protein of unknown function [Eubacterium aggregans]|uniref:DUF2442 domain-containing protein n=1 Tax=Eubacterium aggregans TaxID=81409 RepID=A0A1H3WX56_9FIRM|nr:DUF2442 domain-containing protein [Eubacterium aggregans]SDZ90954.1 Protein of unknown function [Eubacterium aggregans]